jgi:hypothetical protein
MERSLIVVCPCCNAELDIDIATAKVIRHGPRRKPGEDAKADPKVFDDALKQVKSRQKDAFSAFDRAREGLKGREEKLDSAFKDAFKRVKETDDGSKPFNPLEQD